MNALQGTAREGIDTLNRYAYKRIKIGSQWIKIKGSNVGRKHFVSCKRKGVVYMQWEAYRANTLNFTVSERCDIDDLFKRFKPVDKQAEGKEEA